MSLDYNFGNYTYAQCYTIGDEEQQVACLAQHLNVTNPPSIYSYDHYEQLWLSTVCLLWNVTYSNRVLVHGTLGSGNGVRCCASCNSVGAEHPETVV